MGTLTFTTSPATISGAGSYTITPSGLTSSNYTITYQSGTLTVNKAALTVTANNASMTYGGTPPTFTVTATGLVGSDTLTSLGLTFTTNPSIINNAGTYAIVPSLTNAPSYKITYVNGTLTVNSGMILTATGTNLPAGIVGDPYASQAITTYVTASGGTGTGYTYSIASNTLPAGLSFSNNVISGTPQTAGNYSVSVTVTDSANNTASASFPLR